jgi:hypothetical protein
MKKHFPYLLYGVIVLCAIQPIQSQEFSSVDSSEASGHKLSMAVGLKGSSFGFGGEIIAAVSPKIHLRLGGTYFNYGFKQEVGYLDISGDNNIKLGSVSLIANWQFSRHVFLSGGIIHSFNKLDLSGHPTKEFTIGEIIIAPEKVGTLTYSIKPDMVISPYLGIGFGTAITPSRTVTMSIELGAVYHGSPHVDLYATGMLSPTANEDQRQTLENNVSDMSIYPMLSAVLSFRIF